MIETDRTKTMLEEMLAIMEIEGSIERDQIDEATICYRIDCESKDAKLLIGRKGQTLETLQFLVRQMAKGNDETEQHFLLDVLDYRTRRKEHIIEKAKQAAVAVLNGEIEEYDLLPMSAYERRIVHNYLQEHFPDLSSQSAGLGPDRRIVIRYSGVSEE